jgi:hypothetical protein
MKADFEEYRGITIGLEYSGPGELPLLGVTDIGYEFGGGGIFKIGGGGGGIFRVGSVNLVNVSLDDER